MGDYESQKPVRSTHTYRIAAVALPQGRRKALRSFLRVLDNKRQGKGSAQPKLEKTSILLAKMFTFDGKLNIVIIKKILTICTIK